MSDAWGFDDDSFDERDNTDVQNGPKPLRDAYKAMKEKNKALEDRLNALESSAKQAEVRAVFQTLGVDPSVAQNYQGDTNPESVKAWVEGMRSAFGGSAASSETAPQSAPVVSNEQRDQYQRMSAAGNDAQTLGNAEAAMASIKDAHSVEDLLAAWKNIH